MSIAVGNTVTILPPFTAFYPGSYTVVSIFDPSGSSTPSTAMLNDSNGNAVISAFSFSYLQVVS